MPTGAYFPKKNQLIAAIQALSTGNDNTDLALNSIVESLWPQQLIADNSQYTLIRGIQDNEFVIRLIVKQDTTFTNLELLPAGLAIAMTLDDIRYVCYNPTGDGWNKQYALTFNFNKLVSDAPFVLAGNAYINQLHLYDNVGDITSSGFSYTSIGGTGQYTIPLIQNTPFLLNGTAIQDTNLTPGGYIEMVFKGSFIGKF
jgi:hypothetical protein